MVRAIAQPSRGSRGFTMARASRTVRGTAFFTKTARALGGCGLALMLAAGTSGCGGASTTSTPTAVAPAPAAAPVAQPAAPAVAAEPANTPPSISGSPLSTATVANPYRFQAKASDADGDRLRYQIANKPEWAEFDQATGRLEGTPDEEHVGTYSNIRVSVSDGTSTAALAPFTITVDAIASGQVTLSWTAPTLNEDGSALTDLDGFRIYYGRAADALDAIVEVDVGLTVTVVDELTTGTWYFAMTALNSQGAESEQTDVVSTDV
jgi:hypothetical protein